MSKQHDTAAENFIDRIERLERANRRLAWIMGVLGVVALALLCSGQATSPKTPDVLTARAFRVVDTQGKTLASLDDQMLMLPRQGLMYSNDKALVTITGGELIIVSTSVAEASKAAIIKSTIVQATGVQTLTTSDAGRLTELRPEGLAITQNGNLRLALGSTSLVTKATGDKTVTGASSVVMFAADGSVLWRAP